MKATRIRFNTKISVIFVLLMMLSYSCYYDSEEALYPPINQSCDTTNVTYTGTIDPMINDHCIQCHSGTNLPSLITYTDVSDNATQIYGAISHSTGYSPMPQGAPKLNDCLITQMDIWINTGKPQ